MSIVEQFDSDLRESIIRNPAVLLEDDDVMRALTEANSATGRNVVDMRGVAMQRLETRLDDLEARHQSVISAAYENLISTNRIHRALTELLRTTTFSEMFTCMGEDMPDLLQIDAIRLIFETDDPDHGAALAQFGEFVLIAEPGFSALYASGNQRPHRPRKVILRQIAPDAKGPYGAKGVDIRSEALISLDLGPNHAEILLLMGSEDPSKFHPQHGTDLLAFYGTVVENVMRNWLS